MANPSNLQLTHYFDSSPENTEFNLRNLYLHQMYSGPDKNQEDIVQGKPQFGATAVNNWAIYEGVDAAAKLVARAQGMHMNAVNWYNSFIMVFEVDSFKGSTLQIMGATVDENSEWAIVGGTGVFRMARGFVERKLYKKISGGEIQELTISGYCQRKLTVTKLGPWGTQGESVHDIVSQPKRLESVTIWHSHLFGSITFTYTDESGISRTAGRWAEQGGGSPITIELGASEFITGLSGTINPNYQGVRVISHITLVTNKKTYGPLGIPSGTPFTVPVPKDGSIVGFFGSADQYMTSIGVYTIS